MALVNTVQRWLKQLFIGPDPADGSYSTDLLRMFQGCVEGPQLALESNGAAATATTYFWKARTNITIKSAHLVPSDAGVQNATNFCDYFLQTAAGAGGALTNVGTVSTNATLANGNMAAGIPYALTLTAASVDLDAGGVMAYQVTKTGAGGLAIPAHKMVVHYEER